ncbi:MAG TPA: antitermination protein [Serratia grimesii]|uniref:Antitermination protein n=1 Tax=Serratia grimesii TaxID=82995 RepID=A0A9C7QXZ0_9GAMM|nr:antitermination protein [Serratia grimesii]HCK02900.1 antitermination protein [Serratia grimesii]
MRLESIPKYFAPKSPTFSDSPRATASDSLTGTDVIAAFGMCQAQAELGLSAFLGKMGVSDADKVKAVLLLAEKSMADSIRVAPLRKLQVEARAGVVLALSVFAFLDYSRSAASVVACDCCSGTGFIEAEVFTNKVHTPFPAKELVKASLRFGVKGFKPSEYEVRRELRETVRVKCKNCDGKGRLSTACRDCSGRGTAVDKKETEKQGVPVRGTCKRCSGRGYERIPASRAFDAVQQVTDAISLATWEKTVKPFYDGLIRTLECEENHAEQALQRVTA